MKIKFYFLLLILNVAWGIFQSRAQAPQAIPYQAVARDNSGNLITNQSVSLRFSIHDLTAAGTVVYKETQSAVTNSLGLFSVNVGQGSVVTGTFSSINWGAGSKFMQVEMDATGGVTYVNMGTQQMFSVPYSLQSGKSDNIPDGTADGQVLMWNATTHQWVATALCSYFSTTTNCGSCGNVCGPYANAIAGCSGGACTIASCNAGFANCDAVVANGCEINLNTSPTNCGNCTNVCSLANATAGCSSGACTISTCNAGFANCDAVTANGCEINTNTSLSNCGSCGHVCAAIANGSVGCTGGICVVASCNAGFANCNNNPGDGCEVNISTSTSNCGSCGNACSSSNGSPSCSGGTCSIVCNSGFGNCNLNATDGCEINLNINLSNCGSCGNTCSSNNGTPNCTLSICGINCNSGFANCDGNAATNGCEVNLTNSVSNCGSCGHVCSLPNATAGCSGSTCVVSTCNSGFANCNGVSADGCEINTLTSAANCGFCGNTCASGHACVNGICN